MSELLIQSKQLKDRLEPLRKFEDQTLASKLEMIYTKYRTSNPPSNSRTFDSDYLEESKH